MSMRGPPGRKFERQAPELIKASELDRILSHYEHENQHFYIVAWKTGILPTTQTPKDLKDCELALTYYWEDWIHNEPARQQRKKAREMMQTFGGRYSQRTSTVSSSSANPRAPAAAAASRKLIGTARKSKIATDTEDDEDTEEEEETEDENLQGDESELTDGISEEESDCEEESDDYDDEGDHLETILIAKKRKRTAQNSIQSLSTAVAKNPDFKQVADYRSKNIIIAKRKNLKRL